LPPPWPARAWCCRVGCCRVGGWGEGEGGRGDLCKVSGVLLRQGREAHGNGEGCRPCEAVKAAASVARRVPVGLPPAGPFLDGASVHRLMEEQRVTHTAVGGTGRVLLRLPQQEARGPCPAFSFVVSASPHPSLARASLKQPSRQSRDTNRALPGCRACPPCGWGCRSTWSAASCASPPCASWRSAAPPAQGGAPRAWPHAPAPLPVWLPPHGPAPLHVPSTPFPHRLEQGLA
jgi:hypothetical protein